MGRVHSTDSTDRSVWRNVSLIEQGGTFVFGSHLSEDVNIQMGDDDVYVNRAPEISDHCV